MTRFQVDSAEVQQATHNVRTTIDRLQSDVTTLMGQLNGLQGSWTGQAALAFQSAVADWRVTQQQVEQHLAALNVSLGNAATHYADAEQANIHLFRR